ncbi:MAG: transcriptional regulator GcvA [Pseudomonadota bacterium]|nr:transcriptional regulator GcvA [Pseudomonadota bacterium]MEE3101011.1 transcriptional regulator GcvA [Pseudomonadota bacterium]
MPDSDRMPPLGGLRAFEAAARHMSFAKAADELHVTPAALSWQIRKLEEHFGQPLFRRLNRAIELTPAGHALRPGTEAGFRAFREAQRAVRRLAQDRPLVVTAGPALTAKWLAPRLFRFAESHPDIELRFVASLRTMDFDRDGIDAAIRLGRAPTPGLTHRDLWVDRLVPLCTPERARTLRRPEDLADHPLLHDDSLALILEDPAWPTWLRAAGVGGVEGGPLSGDRGPRFSHADHAMDAALDNAGVVLGRFLVSERELLAGRLVAPFGLTLPLPGVYRFLCPPGAERSGSLATFLGWLESEMAATRAAMQAMFPEVDFSVPDAPDGSPSKPKSGERARG